MGQSVKEKCFEDAWDAHKNKMGDSQKIDFDKNWTQDSNGVWNRRTKFWSAMNKFLNWGEQIRRPDLTITDGAGNISVLDLKFTRSDGSVDTWGTKRGLGNKSFQKIDYNDINRQQNNGNSQYNDNPELSPDKCKCNDPKNGTAVAPETSYAEAPDFAQDPLNPFAAPGPLAPGARVPPVRVPPIRIPTPVFP
jgi:hypothetical protein